MHRQRPLKIPPAIFSFRFVRWILQSQHQNGARSWILQKVYTRLYGIMFWKDNVVHSRLGLKHCTAAIGFIEMTHNDIMTRCNAQKHHYHILMINKAAFFSTLCRPCIRHDTLNPTLRYRWKYHYDTLLASFIFYFPGSLCIISHVIPKTMIKGSIWLPLDLIFLQYVYIIIIIIHPSVRLTASSDWAIILCLCVFHLNFFYFCILFLKVAGWWPGNYVIQMWKSGAKLDRSFGNF